MKRTVLIDGDLLLYRFGFRGQTILEWEEEVKTVITSLDGAIRDLDSFIETIRVNTRCHRVIVCLTGQRVFRYDLLPSYKHNRRQLVKPLLYSALKEHVMGTYHCKMKECLEADDTASIIATGKNCDNYVIASIDKDFRQIPAWHFNWDKDARPRLITKNEADKWFYIQALIGDPIDGFSGCPGMGPVGAKKLLKRAEEAENWEVEMWKLIVGAYAAKGLDESYALTQARIARIVRAEDYDFKNKKVLLWEPPTP